MSKPPLRRGRPLKYNAKIADEICKLLVEGKSLKAICRLPKMPPSGTVIGWVVDDVDGFAVRYARAREAQAELYAIQIMAVAQKLPEFATSTKADGTVEKRRDPAYVAWQKNQIDALKWTAAKLRPNVYGEKIDVKADVSLNIADALELARKRASTRD